MRLLEMSISGGALILAAAVIRTLGRDRLPRRTFTALWTLSTLRLTVPVRLPFRLSVWAMVRRTVPHTAAPEPVPAAAVTLSGQNAAPAAGVIQNVPLPDRGAPFPATTALWLAGAALLALVFALVYIRGRRSFRTALPAESAFVKEWLDSHPLRRRIQIRVSDRIAAPLTYGVVRPVILLPKGVDLEDGAALGFVLEHELAHIRRFDAARKLVLAGVVCLHWFNPMVWVLFVLAGRDMELACDEAVLRVLGPDARKEYARTLLSMEVVRGGLGGLASGFSKNAIEERIHAIMKNQEKSLLSAALAVLLVLGAGAVFATAAPEPEAEEAAPTVSSGDVMQGSDGTVYVFTPEGKPVSMTQEEYRVLFTDPAEVEWWTAEEYADWLEQEKKDLQDCLGQRAWTRSDGWFTWTQEKIDETIGMYEQVLEDIRNGLRVSKTVDGRTDAMLMQGAGETPYPSEDDMVLYAFDGDAAYTGTSPDEAAPTPAADKFIYADGIPGPHETIDGFYGISKEEFDRRCKEEQPQWWTYEDYAAQLADAKASLEKLIGRMVTEGSLTVLWDRDRADAYAARYDATLRAIGQGLLLSRTEGCYLAADPTGGALLDALTSSVITVPAQFDALYSHLTAVLRGDESDPDYAAEGYTDLRRELERDGEMTVGLGRLSAGSTVTAAVMADRDIGGFFELVYENERSGGASFPGLSAWEPDVCSMVQDKEGSCSLHIRYMADVPGSIAVSYRVTPAAEQTRRRASLAGSR